MLATAESLDQFSALVLIHRQNQATIRDVEQLVQQATAVAAEAEE